MTKRCLTKIIPFSYKYIVQVLDQNKVLDRSYLIFLSVFLLIVLI